MSISTAPERHHYPAMQAQEPPRRPADSGRQTRDRRLVDPVLTALTALLAALSILGLVGPIAMGGWVFSSIVVIVVACGVGVALAYTRLPYGFIVMGQIVAAFCVLTAMLAPRGAIAGFIPSMSTLQQLDAAATAALTEIRQGVAPISASPSLTLILVACAGILAIVLDIVVVWGRLPVLAALVVFVIALIPPLIVPGPVNATYWVALFIVVCAILRRVTLDSERFVVPRAGVALPTTAAVITVALLAGVGAAPLIHGPRTQIVPGFGPAVSITPSLNLGNDLRRPRDTPILRYATDMPNAPYLRIATLTEYDGATWVPDSTGPSVVLPRWDGTAPEDLSSDVKVTEYKTTIDVTGVEMGWLPVPYPATAVDGVTGEWRVHTDGRTIQGEGGTKAGSQKYTVTSQLPRPSSEQMRAARARSVEFDHLAQLPANTPESITTAALEVTQNATNDYDRLVAMQTWFRSNQFRYSLQAPISDGFDGNSMSAVDEFMRVKAGYCVHFAAAFALMARSLDMPSRIVVGFLPGASAGKEGDRSAFTVTSGDLHAWPEVYFEGIGWIAFEPTQSLGAPTSFAASQPETAGGAEVGATTAPTQAPEEQPSAAPGPQEQPTQQATAPKTPQSESAAWWPYVLIAFGVAALLLIPALLRAWQRRARRSAVLRGSAADAWREVCATYIDNGGKLLPDDTPRDIGAKFVAAGADTGAVDVLVRAIEDASYAPVGSRAMLASGTLVEALDSANIGVRSGKSIKALLLPRSLWPRSLATRKTDAYANTN